MDIIFILIIIVSIIFSLVYKNIFKNEDNDLPVYNKIKQDNYLNKMYHIINKNGLQEEIDFAFEVINGKNVYSIIFKSDSYISLIRSSEIKTGDDIFDSKLIMISNNERDTIARLSEGIRKELKLISDEIISIDFINKSIKISSYDKNLFFKKENLIQFLKLYKKIYGPDNVDLLLINNIKNDSVQKVREKNFEMFLKDVKIGLYEDFIIELKDDQNINIALMAYSFLKDISGMIEVLNTNREKKDTIRAVEYLCDYLNDNKLLNILIDSIGLIDRSKLKIFIKGLFNVDLTESYPNLIDSLNNLDENKIDNSDIVSLIKLLTKKRVKESLGWVKKHLFDENHDVVEETINSLTIIGDVSCVKDLNKIKEKYPAGLGKNAEIAIHILQNDLVEQKGDLAIIDKIETGDLSIMESDGKLSSFDNINVDDDKNILKD